MNKKFICAIITSMLLLAGLNAVNSKEINLLRSNEIESTSDETLDQYQNVSAGASLLVGRLDISPVTYYMQVAQSFIPDQDIITKVEIKIGKNSSATKDLVVAIRDDLTEDNLVEKNIDPADVDTENYSWLVVDIDDLFVDAGETYYLVCYTQNFTDNWYMWSSNNNSESYEDGEAFYSLDNGTSWSNKSRAKNYSPRPRSLAKLDDTNISVDMCFKTYGRKSTNLDVDFKMISQGLKTYISNIGSVNATDIHYEINVSGGLLGLINNVTSGTISDPLEPDEGIEFNSSFFGFGFVEITVEVYASNVLEYKETTTGFVFFSYIFVKKPLI